jgi:hypothetical protein
MILSESEEKIASETKWHMATSSCGPAAGVQRRAALPSDDQEASKSGGQKLYICSLILWVSCALKTRPFLSKKELNLAAQSQLQTAERTATSSANLSGSIIAGRLMPGVSLRSTPG